MTRHQGPDGPDVTPGEWYDGLPAEVHRRMAVSVVAEALADAADEHGVIHNFIEIEFYTRHVARVLNRELADDDVVTPLVYDRFSALALTDAINTLTHQRLLAVNASDGPLDYRLTLPHSSRERSSPSNAVPDGQHRERYQYWHKDFEQQ